MFPLAIVLDNAETTAWMLASLQVEGGDPGERLKTWGKFHERVVNAFLQYQVPTIQLIKSTPKEAVCQVFEKVNTGGVSLTVFELLTATFAADSFNLREDWAARRKQFDEHRILAQGEGHRLYSGRDSACDVRAPPGPTQGRGRRRAGAGGLV